MCENVAIISGILQIPTRSRSRRKKDRTVRPDRHTIQPNRLVAHVVGDAKRLCRRHRRCHRRRRRGRGEQVRRVCANAGSTGPQKFYRRKFRRLQSSSPLMCTRTRQHTLTGFRDEYTSYIHTYIYIYINLPLNRYIYVCIYYIVREGKSFLAYYIHALVRFPSFSLYLYYLTLFLSLSLVNFRSLLHT